METSEVITDVTHDALSPDIIRKKIYDLNNSGDLINSNTDIRSKENSESPVMHFQDPKLVNDPSSPHERTPIFLHLKNQNSSLIKGQTLQPENKGKNG